MASKDHLLANLCERALIKYSGGGVTLWDYGERDPVPNPVYTSSSTI